MRDYAWCDLTDKELLKVRIKDLGLTLEDSDILGWISDVMAELAVKDLDLQPRLYIGDEWFSPDGYNAIAIPFFLLHPRLRKLERNLMIECEGDDEFYFKKLFRHEMGHVFDHAFKVSRRKLWQKHFGSNKKPYTPHAYRPMPYSKGFVQNITEQYAQSHPDEDFAETFAVWLNPNSDWKAIYKGWGALKKLQYVDKLCREFAGVYAPPPRGRMLSEARHLNSTLETYYSRKMREFEDDSPDFYDSELLKVFRPGEYITRYNSAARFLRNNRKQIVDHLSIWTKERKVIINELVSDLVDRSHELKLIVSQSEKDILLQISTFLATLLTNYRLTGRFKKLS